MKKWIAFLGFMMATALALGVPLTACDDDSSSNSDDDNSDDAVDDDTADDAADDTASDDTGADDTGDDTGTDDTADDDTTPVCTGSEIFCEDWEGDSLGAPPSPWQVEYDGSASAAVYEIGTKEFGQAVKLTDGGDSDNVHLLWYATDTITSGVLNVEYDAVLLADEFYALQIFNEEWSYEMAVYFQATGQPANTIFAESNADVFACGSFTVGEWVHIMINIDLNNIVYSVYVNADAGDCVNLHWATDASGPGTVKEFDFYTGGSSAGTGAMDNLRIYVPED